MTKTKRLLAAGLLVVVLSGCDAPWWEQFFPPRQHNGQVERRPVCQHIWPDGHTGCNKEPGTG